MSEGVIPTLIDMLHVKDTDIQYYSAASVSNIAVNEKQRQLITAIGHNDAIRYLVKLLSCKEDKVRIFHRFIESRCCILICSTSLLCVHVFKTHVENMLSWPHSAS